MSQLIFLFFASQRGMPQGNSLLFIYLAVLLEALLTGSDERKLMVMMPNDMCVGVILIYVHDKRRKSSRGRERGYVCSCVSACNCVENQQGPSRTTTRFV